MDWKHIAIGVVTIALGFYLGKNFPGALANVPVLNQVF